MKKSLEKLVKVEVETAPVHTDAEYISYLKNQKKVLVMGSSAYIPFCGTTYTALFNMMPVSINFDNQPHEYPEDVAKFLQRKLDAISNLSVQVKQNNKING